MAMAERRARIVWQGPLRTGSGELQFVSSGIGTYPVTWASRVERPDGRTNPEELLAASHDQAERACPISNARRKNLRITVKATPDS